MKERQTERQLCGKVSAFALTSVYLTVILAAGCVLALISLKSGDNLLYELALGIFHCSFRITAIGAIAIVVMDIMLRKASEK